MFPFPFPSTRTSRSTNSGASTPSRSGSQTSLVESSIQPNDPCQSGNPLISAPLSALLATRSATNSIPPPSTPIAGPCWPPKIPKHTSLQISSTQSLKLDPRISSVSDDGYFGSASKPLSPIVEQDYVSPERRALPLPEDIHENRFPAQCGSEQSETPRQSPVYSTFLNRPLRRSISQMSQGTLRTHRSTVSAPPSIPPLDLLPSFSGGLDSPPLATSSQLSATPLPPIPAAISSPSNGYSATHSENDTSSLHADSFISARSAARSARNPAGQRMDPYSQAEQGSIIRSSTTHSSQSSYSSEVGRRWTTSLSFGSDLLLFSKAREDSLQSQDRPTPACLLFWIGFVAPWCWMIGGWMLTMSGRTKAERDRGYIQPFVSSLWTLEKGAEKGIEAVKSKEVPFTGGYGFSRGYPFIAPSVDSLTPSAKALRMKPLTAGLKNLDPWVVRCRVAAVISGILLLMAFMVAIAVVRRYR